MEKESKTFNELCNDYKFKLMCIAGELSLLKDLNNGDIKIVSKRNDIEIQGLETVRFREESMKIISKKILKTQEEITDILKQMHIITE